MGDHRARQMLPMGLILPDSTHVFPSQSPLPPRNPALYIFTKPGLQTWLESTFDYATSRCRGPKAVFRHAIHGTEDGFATTMTAYRLTFPEAEVQPQGRGEIQLTSGGFWRGVAFPSLRECLRQDYLSKRGLQQIELRKESTDDGRYFVV